MKRIVALVLSLVMILGLATTAFGATAIAAVLKVTDRTVIVLPLTVFCAVLLLRLGQNTKVKGDAAIAIISSSALAIGVIVVSVTSGMNTEVSSS